MYKQEVQYRNEKMNEERQKIAMKKVLAWQSSSGNLRWSSHTLCVYVSI